MISISRAQLQERWEQIPEFLQDEVFSDAHDEVVSELVGRYILTEAQHKKLSYICLVVFLGFLDVKDVFDTIQKEFSVDAKIAMELYEALKSRVFAHAEVKITENYKRWTLGVIPKENIAPLFTSEKITLKKEYAPGTVNLSLKDIPVPQTNTRASVPLSQIPQPTQTFQGTSSTLRPSPFIKSQQQMPTESQKQQPITQNQPISSEVGPLILHKKEDINPIAQSAGGKEYKQMSFGNFTGSFKATPFSERQPQVSQAHIEIPNTVNTESTKQVPFSVKKYEEKSAQEQAKVVHYKE